MFTGTEKSKRFILFFFLLGTIISSPVLALGPRTHRSVPENGEIQLTDYGYRNWAPDVVHYRLPDGRFDTDELSVIDPDGNPVPAQVDGNRLTFIASLPKGETVTYNVMENGGNQPGNVLSIDSPGEYIDVENEYFRLRLPAEQASDLTDSVSTDKVPTPIRQWKPDGGSWMGGMRFADPRKITSYRFKVLHSGPAWFDYEARYEFDNGARYVCRISVSPRIPLARIREELDGRKLRKHNKSFLLLNLTRGVSPDNIDWVEKEGGYGKGSYKTSTEKFDPFLQKKYRAAQKEATSPRPDPTKPESDLYQLDNLVPAGKWGGEKGGVSVRIGNSRVGVVPLHAGSWRRSMSPGVWGTENGNALVGLPLDARWLWWQYDRADERSPFSTHEHDPELETTYARREWGLYFGEGDLHKVQPRYGFIGLNQYKNWKINWDTGEGPSYPRAYFTPEIVEEVKQHLSEHPDKSALNKFYVISGKKKHAVQHGKQFLNEIKSKQEQWHVRGLSHYRQSQQLDFSYLAEDALSCPNLPGDMREEIRRYLALWSYLMSSPDLNPRGAGVHLGNNNMTINRTIALVYFASLLPDHPEYEYWMDRIARYTRFKLASQTSVDGTWVACPNYQLYGPTRFLDTSINILHNTGTKDLRGGYMARTLRYLANLTMRDRRFDHLRIIPGMGNSGDRVESIFGQNMRSAGEDMHAFLRGMHRVSYGPNNGVASRRQNTSYNAFNYLPWKEGEDPKLDTSIFPTYGVMFRDRGGTSNETGMLFRTGMNWSHWDTDVFNVILYGKNGTPLSPGTGYGYLRQPADANNAIYHNRIKLVQHDKKEIFGRVDHPVREYGFGEETDYAMAERFYPGGLYEDKKNRRWRRHILFLKSGSPDDQGYFVMRDTFPGNPGSDRSWWTWLNLGEADNISVNGTALNPDKTPHNKVPDLEKLPEVKGNRVRMEVPGGGATFFWFAGDQPLRCRSRITFTVNMTYRHAYDSSLNQRDFSDRITDKKETKTVFEAMAPRGEDYFYTVYPRPEGGDVPEFQKVGEGVIKVNRDRSTDYAFVSDNKLDFRGEYVMFTARSGAVRIFEDRVVFTIKSGRGKVGYKGHIFKGKAPFERTVKRSELDRSEREVDEGAGKYVRREVTDQVTVWGETPFQARVEDETIKVETDGRKRAFLISRPPYIRRPQYYVDGREWMAAWTDWPDSGGGTWERTHMIGLSVPEGEHTLTIRDMTFPNVWRRPFELRLENVQRE